jgi:ABC-2 type transport system permease protein
MNAFLKHMLIQFKLGLRDKTLLVDFYLLPICFYLIMGGVMSSINPQFKQTLITSMIVFGVTMGALQGVSAPIAKLKESGTLRSYRVLGIPAPSVLLTEVLSTFLHVFFASVIILLTAPVFFKVDLPKNIPAFLVVLALFILATTAVGIFVGAIAKMHMASMLSIVIFVFSVMLSGMMFPSNMLPKALIYAGRILPATFAVQAFNGLSFDLSTDINAGLSLVILVGFSIVFGSACVLKFISINRESV